MLTALETAKIVGLNYRSFVRYVARGEIEADAKAGGHYLFQRESAHRLRERFVNGGRAALREKVPA